MSRINMHQSDFIQYDTTKLASFYERENIMGGGLGDSVLTPPPLIMCRVDVNCGEGSAGRPHRYQRVQSGSNKTNGGASPSHRKQRPINVNCVNQFSGP